jgi:hypothetical protein
MSDSTELAEQAAANVQAGEAENEKKAGRTKKVVEPHACACRAWDYGDATDSEVRFDTECELTTKSRFAQGHDAKLVSTLVAAELDGYAIWQRDDANNLALFRGAFEACASLSEPLGNKALKALQNARDKQEAKDRRVAERKAIKDAKEAEKAKAKAEKEAKKAEAKPPREVPVQVAEGSQEGDGATEPTELAEGERVVTIKVGRNEILATLSADGRTVSWRDSKDEYQERPADTVRILADQQA